MKKLFTAAALALGVACAAQAQSTVVVRERIVSNSQMGGGFYLAIDGGLNVSQQKLIDNAVAESHSRTGGVGGIKAGYAFGNGVVRPVIEGDLYYNGFSQKVSNFNTPPGVKIPGSRETVDSFIYVANFLAKLNVGEFQPYAGVGLGGYYASASTQVANSRTTIPSRDINGFAWQLVAGGDFFLTRNISLFTEYKWQNFQAGYVRNEHGDWENTANGYRYDKVHFGNNERFGSHLIVAGMRLHF